MKRPTRAQQSATRPADHPYCPDAGDLIWINFNPQAGGEQAGRRPALVLSPRRYNQAARLCIVCPITSQAKAYPFEVTLPDSEGISGVVLADHIKSVSWEARNAVFVARAPELAVSQVKAMVAALLQIG